VLQSTLVLLANVMSKLACWNMKFGGVNLKSLRIYDVCESPLDESTRLLILILQWLEAGAQPELYLSGYLYLITCPATRQVTQTCHAITSTPKVSKSSYPQARLINRSSYRNDLSQRTTSEKKAAIRSWHWAR
jgi:hypothetical protein